MYEAGLASDVIRGSDGREWALPDVRRFYDYRSLLPNQMRRAVELFLYQQRLEREAAVLMGVSPTNPVAMYATVGLTKLLGKARAGQLSGCRFDFYCDGAGAWA